jgi:hypothetical protein
VQVVGCKLQCAKLQRQKKIHRPKKENERKKFKKKLEMVVSKPFA